MASELLAGGLSLADFEPHVGRVYEVAAPALALRLISATASRSVAGLRPAFTLLFGGDAQTQLAQGLYSLSRAGFGSADIFLVPVGRDERGLLYEAIFN